MGYCVYCGSKVEGGHSFCVSCGKPTVNSGNSSPKSRERPPIDVAKSLKPVKVAVSNATTNTLNALSNNSKPIFAGFAILALLSAGVFSVILYNQPLDASQIPKYEDAVAQEVRAKGEANLCSRLDVLAVSPSDKGLYAERAEQLRSITEPRKMLAFYNRTNWLVDSSLLTEFTDEVNSVLEQGLVQIVDGFSMRGIDESNKNLLPTLWRSDFRASVFSTCNYGKVFQDSSSSLKAYDSALNRAVKVAKDAPWYPKGYYFSSFINDNVAWKWVDRSKDCYSCYQWDMQVKTKTGCSSNLYIEGNLLSGDSVVGWTNDSLSSIAPGQTGNMRFQSYLSGYGTLSLQVTKISCY